MSISHGLHDRQGGHVSYGLEPADRQRADRTELTFQLADHGHRLQSLLADVADSVDPGRFDLGLGLDASDGHLTTEVEAGQLTGSKTLITAGCETATGRVGEGLGHGVLLGSPARRGSELVRSQRG